MTTALPTVERRVWTTAALIAAIAHVAVAAALVGWRAHAEPDPVEPVMIVELAAPAAAPAAAVRPVAPPITPTEPVPPVLPPVEVPPVRTVMSRDPVVLPPPQPMQPATRAAPVTPAPAAVAAPVPPARAEAEVTRTGGADAPGLDEKARRQEADYWSQLAAYLNRKKSYPAEAKKARQQGVVAVRFTVARNGDVSGIAVRRSSGHDLLDQATLDLLRRVAPLPAFPVSMRQATATITVPIEYSLRTS